MKKLLTTTVAIMAICIIVFAQQQPRSPTNYHGPYDDTYWTGNDWVHYDDAIRRTTLGTLARYSDIIGVGTVGHLADDHFMITVDHALVGCTNGASIMVYEDPETLYWKYPFAEKANYMPTNDSRIVFAVYTNDYGYGARMYWNLPTLDIPWPKTILDRNQLRYLNRSWWHVDRDEGVLFDQFTNVLQAVRFDRNWTNYFHLCRAGANSPSNRVREDSFWDMRFLAILATDERAQFMLNDTTVRLILNKNSKAPINTG